MGLRYDNFAPNLLSFGASYLSFPLKSKELARMNDQPKPLLPSDDVRWKMVLATMRRNGYQGNALIETLHTVQEAFGYLDRQALTYVADSLNVAPSQVHGVATFYHFFQLRPQGDHVCSVCTGTACHIKGSQMLLQHLQQAYNLHPNETTPGDELSLLTVRCIGACGLAPAVVFDGEVVGNMSVDELDTRIQGFVEK
jgi:bidirectional [NiFe] hydrogenase diaphorase subunit